MNADLITGAILALIGAIWLAVVIRDRYRRECRRMDRLAAEAAAEHDAATAGNAAFYESLPKSVLR